jgi:hypothetical protein
MLKGLGHDPRVTNSKDGAQYELTSKEGGNKFVINMKFSASKNILWIVSPLDKSTTPETLSGPNWFRLLVLNQQIAPAFFAFKEEGHQLRLLKPLSNRGITSQVLAAEIESVKKITLDTYPEWAIEQWPANSPAAAPNVAGSTWEFPGESKTRVEFFADGRAKFSDSESPARWSQNGSVVTFSINDFTQWTMTVDGERMKGLWRRLKGDDTELSSPSSLVLIARAGGVPSVAGTTWEFPGASNGKKTSVEFIAGGTAKFSDSGSPAKWSQNGATLVFSNNDYTQWTMTIDGDSMAGSWRRLQGDDTTSESPSSMEKVGGGDLSLPPIPPLKP